MNQVWIHKILGEHGLPIYTSTTIYYDNRSTIQIVENHFSHSKMNHVQIHAHYLRHLVHEYVVSLEYCRTNDQVLDIFTKHLGETRFINLGMMLGIHEVTIMEGYHNDVISPPKSP
jgi:hypothetical protein